MMRYNRIRRQLENNAATLGTRIEITQPFYTELIGASGNFDYVELVAEYTALGQTDLENIARAAELYEMGTMIKVDFQNRGFMAQKAAASGFQAIMFTDHKSAEEVKESVWLMKSDSPQGGGRFGFPNRRFIGCTPYMPQMEHAKRVDDIVLVFMIEKAETIDDLEAICSVPGIDMVQFGPSDYSMSRGWNAGEHKEEVAAVHKYMIETALAHGVRPRVEIFGEPEDALPYMEMGVRDFCFGDQVGVLRKFLNGPSVKMREIMPE